MKILVYSSVFYPSVGGIENLSLVLIEEFIQAGHQVKVVTEQRQNPDKPKQPFEIIHFSKILAQIRLFFWCDLVFMPNITLKGVWLWILNPLKPLYISHNDFHLAYHKRWLAWLKMQVIRRARGNIAVSKSVSDFLNVNCTVIYNCYDNHSFKIYPEISRTKDFVFVGRLVEYKGCVFLMEAFSRLKGNYHLTIIGEGPEYANIKSIVDKNQLNERVEFKGFLQGEALAHELNRHKSMVIPPIEVEGFGIVALEGLACGCEMIVSDAGGLSEAINGFGKIFPMRDVNALVEQMQSVMENKNLNPMSEAKRKYLDGLSRFNVAQKYLEVLLNK